MAAVCITWDAVTALAAVAGVIAVTIQLNCLRKQMLLQNYADYTKRYQELLLNFPENVNEQDFLVESLPEQTRDKTMRYMRAYFDLCFEEWDLRTRKLINRRTWKVWEGGIKTALKKTAFQQAWKIIKDTNTEYGVKFEEFVDQSMQADFQKRSP